MCQIKHPMEVPIWEVFLPKTETKPQRASRSNHQLTGNRQQGTIQWHPWAAAKSRKWKLSDRCISVFNKKVPEKNGKKSLDERETWQVTARYGPCLHLKSFVKNLYDNWQPSADWIQDGVTMTMRLW